jgi:hypothetical protein
MSHGYITEPELMKAMQVQSDSNIFLGKILVMIDVIDEESLQRLMRRKAEEAIYDIFLWREGEFAFVDDELPTMEMIPLQVDVTGLIMEGTRRVDEWQRIRLIIPNETMIPVIVKPVDTDDLDEAQKMIVAAIDGKRSIADMVLESRSSMFMVSETLYRLVREGSVQLVDAQPAKAAAVRDEQRVSGQVPAFREEDEVDSLVQRAQQALRAKEYEKVQRLLRAAENIDPNHAKVRSATRGAEAAILADLHRQGLVAERVPRVAKSFEEITEMNFTPNEGFILSRINGQWDIGSLIKISPIREPDAMLIFYKLWRDGIIALDGG